MPNVLIATGIYPPEIGGPSQYAKNLEHALQEKGNTVAVLAFSHVRKFPTGLRHLLFFLKVFFSLRSADFAIALDTFSVGLPTVCAAKLLHKKCIIRTGGDFLWESYVERTGDLVLFREFYETRKGKFGRKEKIIFALTSWTLKNASTIAFSTLWQRDIFMKTYGLGKEKTSVIENYYGEKIPSRDPLQKNFLGFTRVLKWKNLDRLKKVFDRISKGHADVSLNTEAVPYEKSLEMMKEAYAVILVSLGDISPNMILDAIRANRPFIVTRETGLYERIKDIGIFVDPQNETEIEQAVFSLLNPETYNFYKRKVASFTFTHSWGEIADEFLALHEK